MYAPVENRLNKGHVFNLDLIWSILKRRVLDKRFPPHHISTQKIQPVPNVVSEGGVTI